MARMKVTINEEYCKGCGLCVSVCPAGVLELDLHRTNSVGYTPSSVVRIENCIGCTSCARMCPDVAIRIERLD